MKLKQYLYNAIITFGLCLPLLSCANNSSVVFSVSDGQSVARIYIDNNEKDVVKTAAGILSSDISSILGKTPEIKTLKDNFDGNKIIAGTLSVSAQIDSLVKVHKLQVADIKEEWEAFKLIVIDGDKGKSLLIIGSDNRGTAYGILEVSRMMGVSPWCWWADVKPERKSKIEIEVKSAVQKPSVQYRGIFLNDEDWGLMPWSTETDSPTSAKGAIGPNTYKKVFELLLRLRANTIWPAMHECTVPFYWVEGNKEIADKYGIVVGTSHCEPMMRCSASEWDSSKLGDYDYTTNSKKVDEYWAERVKDVAHNENIYTIGMRGVHDGEMQGASTLQEQVDVLSRVFDKQRNMLATYVDTLVERVPQVFIPYKEVLDVYDAGLKVPDDVTLIWCDDNYGYIRRLSNKEEQKRSGGSGVYYHVSYWGKPHDYLWLASHQPSLIYSEMKRAYDNNARKIWILNVGDIKPAEYLTEFFLDMAWDINSINQENIYAHQKLWIERTLGKEYAVDIANVMKEYYRLAMIRKPEHMGWSRVQEQGYHKGLSPVKDTEFNSFGFGDEIETRIDAYKKIEKKVTDIGRQIPDKMKDAYFELVEYPVRAASLMNKKMLYAQKYRLYAQYGLPVGNLYAQMSDNAFHDIEQLTAKYNTLSNGKWNRMMDYQPRRLPVFEKLVMPHINIQDQSGILLWNEGASSPVNSQTIANITPFIEAAGNESFISIFNRDTVPANWSIESKPKWLNIKTDNPLKGEYKLWLSINWSKVEKNESAASLIFKSENDYYTFNLKAIRKNNKLYDNIQIESKNIVAFDAANYTKSCGKGFVITEGLGYSLKAIQLPASPNGENKLQYTFYTNQKGRVNISVQLLPNYPIGGGTKRYAIALDNETPVVVDSPIEANSEAWKQGVLSNRTVSVSSHYITSPGKHTITLYGVAEGVIADQLLLDFDLNRKIYQLPTTNLK